MAFVDKFSGSLDLPPTHFMPWHLGVHTESPLFFSRVIKDGAGLQRGFQPRIQGGVPLPGMPLFTGDTGEIVLTCKEEIDYALAWFNARRGKWGIFRHRNWMDFKCTETPKAYCYDQDLTTQGLTYPFVGDGVNRSFQLLKAYQNPLSTPTYRLIAAVENDSFSVYLAGVLQSSGWTLDYDTGIITFAAPVASGVAITHRCMFDLWVRFNVDTINIEPIGLDQAKIANLVVIETASNLGRAAAPPVLSRELLFNGFSASATLKAGPILAALPEWTIRSGFKIDPATTSQTVLYSEDGILGTYFTVFYEGNEIGFFNRFAAGQNQVFMTPFTLDNESHEIILSYKTISPTNRRITIYLEGNQVATGSLPLGQDTAIITSQIGRKSNGSGSFLNGSIANLYFYNKELTAVEVAQEHCSTSRSNPNIIAGWHFQEGAGNSTASFTTPVIRASLLGGVQWGNQYSCPA
jgi:uncharacterized protein (TIGR02217 family)